MTDSEILEDLKNIIESEFGIDKENIEEDMELDQELNITDLEIDDLIAKLEEKYDIKIPENKIPTFFKISDLVTYLYENIDSAR